MALSEYNIGRIAAIDWMRGIVMILMALDHASGMFNDGRIFADSILLYEAGSIFATDQFLTRWITHICAPTFVFLAGTGIAINTIQRRAQGTDNAKIDRDILIRGAFIALLDLIVFSLLSGKVVLQVLYAIGISMMLLVPLRRLGMYTILACALVIILGGELFTLWLWDPKSDVPYWLALTFVPSFGESVTVMYPFVPWLAIMMLGWFFGEWLMKEPKNRWSSSRLLMISGILAVTCFVLIRINDGYGNMLMHLEGNSIVQWLHISKYPPSLAYTVLELGLMAIILSFLMWLEPKIKVRKNEPVLVYGQTALFFYLAHFCVLVGLSLILSRGGLEQAYLAALLALVILYPICRLYRTLKWRYPQSVLRFL